MIATAFLKDWTFPDTVRRLHIKGDEDSFFNVMGIYIFGVVLIFIIAVIVWLKMFHICCASKGNENVVDVLPELPDDKAVYKTPESTLAKRKQAILELFETEQVTMVSNDNTVMAKGIRQ
jgi:hypothetical protein